MFELLLQLDKLKQVERISLLSDASRRENSAEHCWHTGMAVWILATELKIDDLDIFKAMKMGLAHDICEIGAGDVWVYDSKRSEQSEREAKFMQEFEDSGPGVCAEMHDLWQEYELQESKESRFVKMCDQLLPFILNIANEGKVWKKGRVTKTMVTKLNKKVIEEFTEVGNWMLAKIDFAVEKGWLKDE